MDFRIDRTPGFGMGRISHLLQIEIRNGLSKAGLPISPEGLSILLMIRHVKEPIRVSDLAKLAVRDGTTLKRQIDGLLQAGLVTQMKDESDGRVVRISCTSAGIEAIAFIQPALDAIRSRAFRGVDSSELDVASEVLDRIQANLLGD